MHAAAGVGEAARLGCRMSDAVTIDEHALQSMLLRHAGKPGAARDVHGVDLSGRPDSRELSVRGWQRAAVLRVGHRLHPVEPASC